LPTTAGAAAGRGGRGFGAPAAPAIPGNYTFTLHVAEKTYRQTARLVSRAH